MSLKTERRTMPAGGRYDASNTLSQPERQALPAERFMGVGAGANVRPPFDSDYGTDIPLGGGAVLDFGCVILDVVEVRIGALTRTGPGVQILTADHPRDPAQRAAMPEFGRPIAIAAIVRIGADGVVARDVP
ncbi:hypothetical protein ACFQ12_22440, partial [Methylobacterium trifolii]